MAAASLLWFLPLKPGSGSMWYPCSGAVPVAFGDRVWTYPPGEVEDELDADQIGPPPYTQLDGHLPVIEIVSAKEANAGCRKAALQRLAWAGPLGVLLIVGPVLLARPWSRSPRLRGRNRPPSQKCRYVTADTGS